MVWGFELAIMLCMIAINAVLASYEIALASVTQARLQRLEDENRPGARIARYMKENMEASLAVVQLGITLAGVLAAAVGGAGAEEQIAPVLSSRLGVSEPWADVLAILVVVLPLTVVTITFGELVPKIFALRNSEWVCLKLSPPMRWFSLSVWPAVWLFETMVNGVMSWGERRMNSHGPALSPTAEIQELRASAALARASRLIGHREESIILGATALAARPVREIMLPAEHISTLSLNATLSENLVAAHLDMHTRFPVTEVPNDPQTIIGYVNVKDIVAALRLSPRQPSIRSILRRLPVMSDSMPIAECLEHLMREHTHIALVRDARKSVVGLISLEDILEELVGEIQDEFDRLPVHAVESGIGWVVGGGTYLSQLQSLAGIQLPDLPPEMASTLPEVPTLADWVNAYLKRPVQAGEVLELEKWRIVVRKVRRQKVQEAQIAPIRPDEPPAVQTGRVR